jgi:soluble lytic murein transglycosylase-like protein
MSEKNLEALIVKVVKRAIKKELQKLEQEILPSVTTQNNQPIEAILDTSSNWEDEPTTEKLIDDIYIKQAVNLPTKEDAELERKLKELKFRQELRKDWILFIVRDVVLFPSTVVFIFVIAAYFVFVLFNKL